MDIEKILFIVIALALSVFSLYKKSKKQQQQHQEPVSKEEDFEYDFQQQQELYYPSEPILNFEQKDIQKTPQNFNILTKKEKKREKQTNFETFNLQAENAKNILRNDDLERDIILLEDFEGTEIQKAFLYSEIFKNAKN